MISDGQATGNFACRSEAQALEKASSLTNPQLKRPQKISHAGPFLRVHARLTPEQIVASSPIPEQIVPNPCLVQATPVSYPHINQLTKL